MNIFMLIGIALVIGLVVGSLINLISQTVEIRVGKEMMKSSQYREKVNSKFEAKQKRVLDKAARSQELYANGEIISNMVKNVRQRLTRKKKQSV